jgi:hypothetical protein
MTVDELGDQIEKNFEMNNRILEEKFNNVHLELRAIKEQTTKTNGRVTKLEDKGEANSLIHINCPVKKELDAYKNEVKDDLLILTFARKYPKVTGVLCGLLIMLIVSGGMEGFLKVLGAWLGV